MGSLARESTGEGHLRAGRRGFEDSKTGRRAAYFQNFKKLAIILLHFTNGKGLGCNREQVFMQL